MRNSKFQIPNSKFPAVPAGRQIPNSKFFKGFTLIEILVVISIIGILAALLTSSYSQAQKQGRDARRRGDLKSIQNAFEQYKVTMGSYPASLAASSSYFQGNQVPKDPKDNLDYPASFDSETAVDPAGLHYCVCALLEAGTGTNGVPSGNAGACNTGATTYICVHELQ